MKKKVLKGSLITIVLLIATICGLFVYSEKINKIEVIENAKRAVDNLVSNLRAGTDSADMTVDITNIVNDAYPEHEHVWYDEYDETNHWKKCSICKEVKDLTSHTLTTTWALGYESCEAANSYTTICECGYGTVGRKPCVWNGTWENQYIGYNYHNRRCVNCNVNISDRPYIDNTNGGRLVVPDASETYATGVAGSNYRCILSDGSPRPCGSNEKCSICGGPVRNSKDHTYVAIADNTIKCQYCGKERWDF